MKRLVVLIAIGAVAGAFGALACGGGGDKPPLTPDSEHMATPPGGEDAGGESTGETGDDAGA